MAEKTEQPTPKRLREARERGQVCKSQDVTSAAIIVAMLSFMALYFVTCRQRLEWLFESGFAALRLGDFDAGVDLMRTAGMDVFIVVGLVPPLIAAVVGVVANMGQVGFLAAFESVIPKLDKLNPGNWFKNVFSKKNLLEFVKGVIKMSLIAVVFWKAVEKHLGEITGMPLAGFEAVLSVAGYVLWDICKWVCGLFVVVAAVDYLLQRRIYTGEMMMSHEEVKNEYKEMEGDPTVKAQRKQLHQEIIFGEDEVAMDNSTVVVTNPSHYAVALRYVKGETQLPVVMMKGMDGGAVRIMRMAEHRGIPIFRNVPLARSLFTLGETLQYIPSDLIEPVAEVIRWLREQYPVANGMDEVEYA
ncbi:MAG: type III secretion system export apparatus subunit SctU [Planctomycetaceae bacterium]|nr:type III secretion system export apparatus subunit SctU [Planctomycetaceae bacterium]